MELASECRGRNVEEKHSLSDRALSVIPGTLYLIHFPHRRHAGQLGRRQLGRFPMVGAATTYLAYDPADHGACHGGIGQLVRL
jgi:hypothetical protein